MILSSVGLDYTTNTVYATNATIRILHMPVITRSKSRKLAATTEVVTAIASTLALSTESQVKDTQQLSDFSVSCHKHDLEVGCTSSPLQS